MNIILSLIKKYTFISMITLILLTNAITDFPLQDYLSNYMSYVNANMICIFVKQMSCFAVLLYLSHKLKITDNYNLTLKKPLKSFGLIIPLILLCIINTTNIDFNELSSSKITLVLYFFAFLSTGFFEEILFRGIVFNCINNKYGNSKKSLYFSVIIANVLFGACHITVYLAGSEPFVNFLNQCMYATVIGVLFNAIYLRCNSLLVPIIIHGLIDVTGCTEYLAITSKALEFQMHIQQTVSIHSIIKNLIIFIPILIWSLFILRKIKTTEVPDNSISLE